jgi:hypothetical protein
VWAARNAEISYPSSEVKKKTRENRQKQLTPTCKIESVENTLQELTHCGSNQTPPLATLNAKLRLNGHCVCAALAALYKALRQKNDGLGAVNC